MNKSGIWKKSQVAVSGFWNSRYYLPVITAVSCAAAIANQNLIGMFAMVFAIIVFLVFCDDIMACVLPAYFMLLLCTTHYANLTTLLGYVWYAVIPFALALAFNLIYYRRPLYKGIFLPSLLAVSVALVLGGIGTISAKDYFSPTGLYYMLGLGFLMVFIYCLAMSRMQNERDYDRLERLATAIYAAGIFAALVVLLFYIRNIDEIINKGGVIYYKPRNFIASVLLMSLPMPAIFIKKSNLHLIGIAVIFLALVTVGSRSGLVFGPIVLFATLVYIYFSNRKCRNLYIKIAAISAIPLLIIGSVLLPELYSSRLVGGKLISNDETRTVFIECGIRDFLTHPLLGIGIGNTQNTPVFLGIIPGSLVFYHNLVMQVMGSMGLVGIAAYIWQGCARVKFLWERRYTKHVVFGLSYLAIILMSLTNPGIFCPFPEAALLVTMFAVMEGDKPDLEENKLK